MAARLAHSENDMIGEMTDIIEKLTVQLENKDRLIEDLKKKIVMNDMNHKHQILRLVEEISLLGGGADSARSGGGDPRSGGGDPRSGGGDPRSGGGADSARGDPRSGGGADSARGDPRSATVLCLSGAARGPASARSGTSSSGDTVFHDGRGGKAPSNSATVLCLGGAAVFRDGEAPSSSSARGSAAASTRIGGGAAVFRDGEAPSSSSARGSAASTRVGGGGASTHDGRGDRGGDRGGGSSSISATVFRVDGARASASPPAFVINGDNTSAVDAYKARTLADLHEALTRARAHGRSSE
jgi:hypothetical protein